MLEPSLTAFVSFRSLRTGLVVEREFVISKEELNDVSWQGGDTGDIFFDNMESDLERFGARVDDCVHSKLWEFMYDENIEPDPDLVGDHPEGLDESSVPNCDYDLGSFDLEDFFP